MMMVFQCPDCHTLHAEPLEAAYTLGVRCADCLMATDPARVLSHVPPAELDAAWASVTRAAPTRARRAA